MTSVARLSSSRSSLRHKATRRPWRSSSAPRSASGRAWDATDYIQLYDGNADTLRQSQAHPGDREGDPKRLVARGFRGFPSGILMGVPSAPRECKRSHRRGFRRDLLSTVEVMA